MPRLISSAVPLRRENLLASVFFARCCERVIINIGLSSRRKKNSSKASELSRGCGCVESNSLSLVVVVDL